MKVRAGRGFTLDELAAAKMNRNEARSFGIAVDHRRKNRSEEAFKANVQRLKLYKSKLVVFPRNPTSKRAKAGDSTKQEREGVEQVSLSEAMPIEDDKPRIQARKATKDEKAATVTAVLRKALTDGKLWGVREKRAKDKAEAELAKGKGKKKK